MSLSSSLPPLDGAVSLCAQAIMKLSVTSHNSHWALFIQQTQTQTHTYTHWCVWKHTDSCEHKHTHVYTRVGKLWMNEHFLSSSSTVIFWVPMVCGWSSPSLFAVMVDLINVPHDRHTARHTCTVWYRASQFSDKMKCKQWHLVFSCACTCTHLPFCRGAFGYWVFTVHVYFSSVIYNSISSVHWCASYLQNTKQSPNPIVFQSN